VDLGATTALVARIALAVAFGLSAGTKLAHRSAFSAALGDFGVPGSTAVAWALPPVEAAVAVLLVAVRAEPWPAFLAIALLAIFTAAVVANLTGGRTAPCPCFGPPAADARPVSAATVARNGYLVALAVVGTGSTNGASPAATAVGGVVIVAVTIGVLRRFG
jgi:hypothetical protein